MRRRNTQLKYDNYPLHVSIYLGLSKTGVVFSKSLLVMGVPSRCTLSPVARANIFPRTWGGDIHRLQVSHSNNLSGSL